MLQFLPSVLYAASSDSFLSIPSKQVKHADWKKEEIKKNIKEHAKHLSGSWHSAALSSTAAELKIKQLKLNALEVHQE